MRPLPCSASLHQQHDSGSPSPAQTASGTQLEPQKLHGAAFLLLDVAEVRCARPSQVLAGPLHQNIRLPQPLYTRQLTTETRKAGSQATGMQSRMAKRVRQGRACECLRACRGPRAGCVYRGALPKRKAACTQRCTAKKKGCVYTEMHCQKERLRVHRGALPTRKAACTQRRTAKKKAAACTQRCTAKKKGRVYTEVHCQSLRCFHAVQRAYQLVK